jgi:uncharacterized caspase-like protein
MRWIHRVATATAFILCLMSLSAWSAVPRRVALVIGNSTYAEAPHLANPAADAKLVAGALHKAGFTDVDLELDLNRATFEKALRAFQHKADGAEVALIYYAGHGLEVSGRNWLLPIDATLAEERDLPYQGIDLDMVLGSVTEAQGLRVVVLDACRDNPFTRSIRRTSGTRGIANRGLADIEVTGTLVLYAQRAGQTALDGTGSSGDSPFATALAARLPERGVDIRLLVSKVRDDVLAATGGKQEPFSYGSLPGIELELVPAPATGGAPAVTPPAVPARDQVKATSNRVAGLPAQNTAPAQNPERADSTPSVPRDEAVSAEAEGKGDSAMLEALTMGVCLKTNCMSFQPPEIKRQTTLMQHNCVAAKKQWRLALNTTTSPERAMKLKSKVEGKGIQCRRGFGCSETGWPGYNYIAPDGSGDIEIVAGFHCSDTDSL